MIFHRLYRNPEPPSAAKRICESFSQGRNFSPSKRYNIFDYFKQSNAERPQTSNGKKLENPTPYGYLNLNDFIITPMS